MTLNDAKKKYRKRILRISASLEQIKADQRMYIIEYTTAIEEECEPLGKEVVEKCLAEFVWYNAWEKTYFQNLTNPQKLTEEEVTQWLKDERRRSYGK